MGWLGITISSVGEEIVKALQENTKMTQIGERGAESRIKLFICHYNLTKASALHG
jgi:hypothetical protein